MRKMLI